MRKILGLILFLSLLPNFALADTTAMTLTVTPTLVKNNVAPGDLWKSSIKVINNNPETVIVSVKVRDFKGGKETGQIEFIDQKISQADKEGNTYLSNWVKLDYDSFALKPFESREVPFIVVVPSGAQPGGHYAAMLISTIPPKEQVAGTTIKIASSISSLLFLKVKGAIVEEGQVREFSTSKEFYQDSNVNFVVRFENKGNTHILPQGEIRVKNFLGQESEPIKINQQTEFGSVLPKDVRRWDFSWNAGNNWWDMGRYRADLLLRYGEETKETTGQYFYFWIIRPKPLLTIFGSLLFVILFLTWLVKSWVRKAVQLAQGGVSVVQQENAPVASDPVRSLEVKRPVISQARGVIDLKERLKK